MPNRAQTNTGLPVDLQVDLRRQQVGLLRVDPLFPDRPQGVAGCLVRLGWPAHSGIARQGSAQVGVLPGADTEQRLHHLQRRIGRDQIVLELLGAALTL